MTWQAWTLSILIVAFIAVQYSLVWSAINDLLRRPRVRGNSHTFWALAVLCVPIFGALVYGAIGPTSFRSSGSINSDLDAFGRAADSRYDVPPANVTPFRKRTGTMTNRLPEQRPGVTRSRAHNSGGAVTRFRLPGA